MNRKLEVLDPALKPFFAEAPVEDGVVNLMPSENWVIREEVMQFYKETIQNSDLTKV
jgi:hypothetical protein